MVEFKEHQFSVSQEPVVKGEFRDICLGDLLGHVGDEQGVMDPKQWILEKEQEVNQLEMRASSCFESLEKQVLLLKEEKDIMWGRLKKNSIAFAIELAKHIINVEIQSNVQVIEKIVDELMAKRRPKEKAVLRMSDVDVSLLKEKRPDIFEKARDDVYFEVQEDNNLSAGCAFLDTDLSRYEMDYHHQLESLAETIIALANKDSVGTCPEITLGTDEETNEDNI